MLNRAASDASSDLALTTTEIRVLDKYNQAAARRKILLHYLTRIARFGGYLARATDPPPGTLSYTITSSETSSWVLLSRQVVGNRKPHRRDTVEDFCVAKLAKKGALCRGCP